MANRDFLKNMKVRDWVSLASGAVLVGAIYLFLVHPSLRSLADLPRFQMEAEGARELLTQTQSKLERLQDQIVSGRELLAEQGGGPPVAGQKDLRVGQLTSLAQASGIQVDRYAPLDNVDYADHRSFMVEFTGRGGFGDAFTLLERIETAMEYVDVTHFAIEAAKAGQTSNCTIRWSCRVNGIRPELGNPDSDGGGSLSGPVPREVAWHGP